jgi:ribulose-phosphate 3-epimerase
LNRTVNLIKEHGALAGVVLNPATSLELLEPILADVDFILLMSVNPGFGGQRFIPSCLSRIRALKDRLSARALQVEIEVDGGINEENYRQVVLAGTDILVAGSSIFNHPDPAGIVSSWCKFKNLTDRDPALV